MNRKLSLKREVLADLADDDLRAIAGGAVTETCFSCLTFVSCNPLHCVTRYPSVILGDCDPTGDLTVRC